MNIEKIYRNNNVINSSDDLEFLHKFKNFPVFMGCTNQSIEEDLFFDMQWQISRNTGIIQLNPLLPLKILYPESHGSGNIGNLWLEHHQKFAKFIHKQSPSSVLEIGGLHGILSREYNKKNIIDWTIIEPNPSPLPDVKATFIKGFFDKDFTFNGKIDTVVHSHVFEHVYDPNEFICNISNFLEEGQKLIFSIPNLEVMLQNKYNNCINFEHTLFLTEPYIDFLLSKHGFKQIDKIHFKKDHSIFYSYVKSNNVDLIELPINLYDYNKNLYLDYVTYHQQLIKELNFKIQKNIKGQPIFLFGAHVFAQYLIAFGLDMTRIICLLDNDPNKQGKRLYGTNMMVKSPQSIKDEDSPVIILKAGVYNNEIKKDILENINRKAQFWE